MITGKTHQGHKPRSVRGSISLVLAILITTASAPLVHAESTGGYDFQVQPDERERAAIEAVKGKIPGFVIFESNREGKWHLYRMNADGTDVRRLTENPTAKAGDPTYAAISPDGSTIAWEHRYDSQDAEIWLMDADGGNQRPLYAPAGEEDTRGWRPAWLPDGRLKFTRNGSQLKQTVWIYDFNKKDPEKPGLLGKLTGQKEPELPDGQRSWQETLLFDMKDMSTKFKTKRMLLHEMAPDLHNFAVWAKYPGRGVWWMSIDGKKQEKIHGGCSPRVMPDGKNFTWVFRAGKFGIGSFTEPVQTQVLFDGPHPAVFDHGYFPYLTPDYQWLIYSACPLDQHDQEKSNYQVFIVKMGPDLKPVGDPVRLTFNNATDRYPVMWYEGMKSPETPPVIQGNAHEILNGPDDFGPEAGDEGEAGE